MKYINKNYLQSFKFQVSSLKSQVSTQVSIPAGFTFVELLTSVALFAVIGLIGISMLTFTLRGAKKTDAMENIRQNGDVALSKMVRTIRYATSIDDPVCTSSVVSQELTMTPVVGNPTTFSCTSVPDSIAVDGVSLIDTSSIVVRDCSFTCRKDPGTETPTVTINFTLSTKGSSGLFENNVSIPFQSSISIRNASK
jgi:prepilin-type N-terminal cleavage/methylation domain-containing protein